MIANMASGRSRPTAAAVNLCIVIAVSLIVIGAASRSFGETPEAAAASKTVASLRSCNVADLPPLFAFINKNRKSDDVDMEFAVAEAESKVSFVYLFQSMQSEARPWLRQIVKKYENQTDERLQLVAAEARLSLSGLEKEGAKKRAVIEPIVTRYRDSKNLDLLSVYAQALEVLADTERGTDKDDDGRRFAEEASEVKYAIDKQRPPGPVEFNSNDLCT